MNLKRLCTTTVNSAATVAYTADSVSARIDAITLTNDSGSAVTVSIWLPAGGNPSAANRVLKDKSIGAGLSYVVKEAVPHTLEDGHTLVASASTGGVVALVASGIEIEAAA